MYCEARGKLRGKEAYCGRGRKTAETGTQGKDRKVGRKVRKIVNVYVFLCVSMLV